MSSKNVLYQDSMCVGGEQKLILDSSITLQYIYIHIYITIKLRIFFCMDVCVPGACVESGRPEKVAGWPGHRVTDS